MLKGKKLEQGDLKTLARSAGGKGVGKQANRHRTKGGEVKAKRKKLGSHRLVD